MKASVIKHKQVKTSWPPLPSSSGKGSSCSDGRYKVLLNYSPALPQGIPQIRHDEYDDYNAPPSANMQPRLVIPAGILRIPVFSSPVALFSQESRFLFLRIFFFSSSGVLSVPGLRT